MARITVADCLHVVPNRFLLVMVAAFAGREFLLEAYQHAIEAGYRFYSYGDCMWIR